MITEDKFKIAANELGCDTPAIKAVNKVESSGGGFLAGGGLKLLFEPHIFWKELKAVGIDPGTIQGNSDILYPSWKPGTYGKESAQQGRLDRAMKINETAALKSASYGSFQILGNNHVEAGYITVQEMVHDYKRGEFEQLMSFVKFLKNTGIAKWLIKHNWAKFAELYNGKGYKGSSATTADDYDLKLAAAYKSFS